MLTVSLSVVITLAEESEGSGIDAAIDAISKSPLAIIMVLYSFLVFWSVAGLGGYHCYLSSRGITTNEDIKGGYKQFNNPFNRSFCTNLFTMFCPPHTLPYIPYTNRIDILNNIDIHNIIDKPSSNITNEDKKLLHV